jgi:hypothetical protein
MLGDDITDLISAVEMRRVVVANAVIRARRARGLSKTDVAYGLVLGAFSVVDGDIIAEWMLVQKMIKLARGMHRENVPVK